MNCPYKKFNYELSLLKYFSKMVFIKNLFIYCIKIYLNFFQKISFVEKAENLNKVYIFLVDSESIANYKVYINGVRNFA